MTEFLKLENPKGTIYIKENELDRLAKIDTIVFETKIIIIFL